MHRTDTGERLYSNTFATNFTWMEESVESVGRSGRARGKAENENNTVLKNYGDTLEHHSGPGENYLSAVRVTRNLRAFLIHTIWEETHTLSLAIRQEGGHTKDIFDVIRALTRYLYCKAWDAWLTFRASPLEIQLEPDSLFLNLEWLGSGISRLIFCLMRLSMVLPVFSHRTPDTSSLAA